MYVKSNATNRMRRMFTAAFLIALGSQSASAQVGPIHRSAGPASPRYAMRPAVVPAPVKPHWHGHHAHHHGHWNRHQHRHHHRYSWGHAAPWGAWGWSVGNWYPNGAFYPYYAYAPFYTYPRYQVINYYYPVRTFSIGWANFGDSICLDGPVYRTGGLVGSQAITVDDVLFDHQGIELADNTSQDEAANSHVHEGILDEAELDELFGAKLPKVNKPLARTKQTVSGEEVVAYAADGGERETVQLAGWKAPRIGELSSSSTRNRGPVRVERAKPAVRLLTPTSPAWADSATGTIDDLVQRGEFEAAIESCDAMSRNPKLPADIYLRYAILKLFATREAVENDKVLDLLNAAAAGGCDLNPVELNCESVRIYIAPMEVSFDETLDQFSKSAMRDPNGSVDLLLLISALLKLDGQTERSAIFAKEAFERASKKGELKWTSLTIALQPE